jgi:hypothetical protein
VTKVYPVGDLAADEKQADALIRVLTRAAEPSSWQDRGGGGAAEYFAVGKSLVVRNTTEAHKEVAELLRLLRDARGKDKQ